MTAGVCSGHWLEADEAVHGADRIEQEMRHVTEDEALVVDKAEDEWWRDRIIWGERIGGSAYENYLRSRKWAVTRALAVHRANRMCQVCGERYYLEVHHKTYKRLGNEEPDDLIVLCRSCHAKVHERPVYRPHTGRGTRW